MVDELEKLLPPEESDTSWFGEKLAERVILDRLGHIEKEPV